MTTNKSLSYFILFAVFSLMICSLLISVARADDTANLIEDPGFETTTSNFEPNQGGTSVNVTTANPISGSRSLVIGISGYGDSIIWAGRDISAFTNKRYSQFKGSVRIRATVASASGIKFCGLIDYVGVHNSLINCSEVTGAVGDKGTVILNFNIDSSLDVERVRVGIFQEGSASLSGVLIDDVSVVLTGTSASTPVPTPTPTPTPVPTTSPTPTPIPTPTPVNGVCGSANGNTFPTIPTYNLCATGTASSVAGSGPWTWTCAGTNGGTTASCSAQKTVVTPPPTPTPTPTPAPAKFTVGQRVKTTAKLNVRATPYTSGTRLGTQPKGALGTIVSGPTTANGYNWWKINYDTGADGYSVENYLIAYTAPTPTPVNGVCGSANGITVSTIPTYNLCSTGTASSVAGSGPWTWTCAGTNGGTTASCSAQKTVVTPPPTPSPTPTTPPPTGSGASYPAFNLNDPADAPLIKFAETWARNWNYEGHSVNSSFTEDYGNWNYGETVYEPWLFDRASVGYYLYKRSTSATDKTRWYQQFLSDFAYYRNHISTGGYFTPKTGEEDGKYGYITPFLLYERETGDAQYRPIAQRIYNFSLSDFGNTYSTGGMWTEREIGLALDAAVSWYDLTRDLAVLARINALVTQWTTVANAGGGVPLTTIDQHEGGGSSPSQLVTSPWMSALYFQAAQRLYALNGNAEVLQQVIKYADWMEQYAYFDGSVVHPEHTGVKAAYYLVGPTGPYTPETPGEGDFDHCLDVSGLVSFAIKAKQAVGQSTTALVSRQAQLRSCAAYAFTNATRTTNYLPKYRLNPPRKFNWWMRSTIFSLPI